MSNKRGRRQRKAAASTRQRETAAPSSVPSQPAAVVSAPSAPPAATPSAPPPPPKAATPARSTKRPIVVSPPEWAVRIFFALVVLTTVAPLVSDQDFVYGAITAKAFYFRILVELTLPLYLYLVVSTPRLRPRLRNPVTLAAIAFLAINLITSFTGISPQRSLWGTFDRMGGTYYIAHLLLFYFYVLLLGRLGGTWQRRFLSLFLVVPAAVALNGLFEKLGLPYLAGPDTWLPSRVGSTLGNPVYLGAYLIIPLAVSLWFAIDSRRRDMKALYGAAALLYLVGIYLSVGRGAFVGLLAGAFVAALVYVLLTPNSRVRRTGLALVGGSIIAVLLLFTLGSHLPIASLQRLLTLKDNDTSSRLVQWGIALKGYPSHPILGVGPENYYYVGFKYYNPAAYVYDPGSFDKPHNYFLELLVTIGPLGLLAYLAMIGFAIWAAHRAYTSGQLRLSALALLLGGLISYEVQDFTGFEALGGSLTFFALLGVAGCFWHAKESYEARASAARNSGAGWIAALAAALVMVPAIVITNVGPAQAAAQTVSAAIATNPQASADAFQAALDAPNNFDRMEVANEMERWIVDLATTPGAAVSQDFVRQQLQASAAALQDEVAQDPSNTHTWENLATVYITGATLFGGGTNINGLILNAKLDPNAEVAVNHALDLAPARPEPKVLQVRIRFMQNRLQEAEAELAQLAADFPTDIPVHHLQALSLELQGRHDEAVAWFERSVELGFTPLTFTDVNWVGQYYHAHHEYAKEVALYERTFRLDPTDTDMAVALVKAYLANGQRDAAVALYQQIIAHYPDRASQLPDLSGSS